MELPKKLVIDRSKYAAGVLMRPDGCGCAMGHLLLAAGIPQAELNGNEWSDQVGTPAAKLLGLGGLDPQKELNIASYSDCIKYASAYWKADYELRIINELASIGVEVSFEGEYPTFVREEDS